MKPTLPNQSFDNLFCRFNRFFLRALYFIVVLMSTMVYAQDPRNSTNEQIQPRSLQAGCEPGVARAVLDINNVRTTILSSGDLWTNIDEGRYEVPKRIDTSATAKNAIFIGGIWMGGVEDGFNLKVAAMTYRQDGGDFWPGPLDVNSATANDQICAEYDRIWDVKRADVLKFIAYYECYVDPQCNPSDLYPGYVIPRDIREWPGNRPDNSPEQLAPYYDRNSDGFYNVLDGDYPLIDVGESLDCQADDYLLGDQNLWWVFNDAGNEHTLSGTEQIGVEVQAQAYALATNDELNDMTFYSYKIINRSNSTYEDFYFGTLFDVDLGFYGDDFVGFDEVRGLGYAYNGDNLDEGPNGYGQNVPALGYNYFQGPMADLNDGIDNDRDGTIDEEGERIATSCFMTAMGDFSMIGFPTNGQQFYYRMKGQWLDGSQLVNNGTNGYAPTGGPGVPTNFMYTGNPITSSGWTESTAGNTPSDRRWTQSVGPFTLEPGAVNKLQTGVVWARASSGDRLESLEKLWLANDLAQNYFDNCFARLEGPDAPDMEIQELDQEVVLYLSNAESSNNYLEQYEEPSPYIVGTDDTTYVFEGYQIFQLRDPTVEFDELYDPDKARLVAQVDIDNGVEALVNYVMDPAIGALVPQLMTLQANDNGIEHSFLVTDDQFATGNRQLINHKEYYYTVVAYAYNNFKPYDPTAPDALDGQKAPYLQSVENMRVYKAIPHKIESETYGTSQMAEYGDGPLIRRLDGKGNGGMYLEFTSTTMDSLVNFNILDNPEYQGGAGPVNVKVVDPLRVPNDRFTLVFDGDTEDASWYIYRESIGDTVYSERTIEIQNEQIIPDWGMSITITESLNPGNPEASNNGLIGSAIHFEDPLRRWLTGVSDLDGASPFNWIRSGTANVDNNPGFPDYEGIDDSEYYEGILEGTWAPYRLVSNNIVTSTTPNGSGPGWTNFQVLSRMEFLHSVDVVFTSDKSKWTRVPVLEAGDDPDLAIGNAEKLNLRESPSVDKDGNPDGTGTGWGWFPGYAVDLETGIRLNIMFAEDSWKAADNGNDMLWNPTDRVLSNDFEFLFGGKHFTYIMRSQYLGDNETDNPYYPLLNNPTNINKRQVFQECLWVTIPLVAPGEELLSNDARVSIRVLREYENYTTSSAPNGGNPMYGIDTEGLAVGVNDVNTAEAAMSTIRVVPNPYYAYSAYESNDFDRRVKITNLPVECDIRIYTLNGNLVRHIRKDNPLTFVEWDLTNSYGRLIGSGMYIIHVQAPEIGDAFVKWFGAMRDIDTGGN